MEPVSDDKRIRSGLKFLAKADRAFIRASIPLERLTGISKPQGKRDLLGKYSFRVANKKYKGVMTQDQNAYLLGHLGNLREFADAIAQVLILSNNEVVIALGIITDGLGAPGALKPAVTVPAVGCCSYDTGQEKGGITETYCTAGLLGTGWYAGDCHGDGDPR